MSENQNQKAVERIIPGMMNRHERFAEAEHADNIGATVKRIVTYFMHEKTLVICMLAIVIFGTLCGIYAPGLQSSRHNRRREIGCPFPYAAAHDVCVSAL